MSVDPIAPEAAVAEISRHRTLSGPWYWLLLAGATASVLLSVYQIFGLGNVFGTTTILVNQYIYLLIAFLLPLIFVYWPATKHAPANRVPWYDAMLFAATIIIAGYFAYNANAIIDEAWEYDAPPEAVYVSYALWVLVLEATRRAGGIAIFVIVMVLSSYPFFADKLPPILSGLSPDWKTIGMQNAMSEESILGIPMRAFANLVIGFLIFGVALQHTGGGRFFLNLAFALLGHVRGGPAKVAIFASGLMGSMSGSVVTNVLTTGVMTIPAMKRVGFPRAYAGGVETCASTGGVLMPPIMGATAFVMAVFLNVPYVDIAVAAVIPSVMYFFGLFMQIDAYAARNDLKGLPRDELPSLRQTLKEGWYFVAVFVLLIWMLVFLKQETIAPYYATALLILVNQLFPYHRWTWAEFIEFVASTGRLFAELAAILAGIGLIVGALVITGKIGNIANDLLQLAGGSTVILLLMGAMTSFVLGVGMTVTAAYVFLAIALAPALIKGGLDPMAVHLFILYWGMLSYITPPVALGAYAAAPIAKAKPMETGFQAMRLGSIIYFIPFFFVFDPAFILRGDLMGTLFVFTKAMVGILFIAGALQGYLLRLGSIGLDPAGIASRALLILGGLTLALPASTVHGLTNLQLVPGAVVLIIAGIGFGILSNRKLAVTVSAD